MSKFILTQEQIDFLDKICGRMWSLNENGEVDVDVWVDIPSMNLTEIPIKFGKVSGWFNCSHNNLTTLKNYPTFVGGWFDCSFNNLTNYFKSIKEEDFPYWKNLGLILDEYPFLINIVKKYLSKDILIMWLNEYPQTKLYLE